MKPKRDSKSPRSSGLTGIDAALRRAAQRARDVAESTGTPLVIYKDGKIEKRMVTRGPRSKSN